MSRVIRQEGVTILELDPSYDSLDDEALSEFGEIVLSEAVRGNPARLILDLSATQHIGSSFIELLVRAWKRIQERGGTMVLCGLQPFCIEVLEITRLNTLWPAYPTRDEAVAALTGR